MSVVFFIRCRYYHYYYFLFYSSCLFPSVISCVCLFQLVTFIFLFLQCVCLVWGGEGGEGTAGHMTSGLVWYLWGLGMGKGELT